MGRPVVLLIVAAAVLVATGRGGTRATSARGAAAPYRAEVLDRGGKLLEALPLYRVRLEQTQTKADRLRYAGALLRAGRDADAKAAYDQLLTGTRTVEPGRDAATTAAALCASSMLVNGFPSWAVDYLRPAYAAHGEDRRLALLMSRALSAAGDDAAARHTLAALHDDRQQWVVGERIELARCDILSGDLAAGRALFEVGIGESVGQMFRDSILAGLDMGAGNWAEAVVRLGSAERKVPLGLNDKRVGRSWRNVQRELRAMQLRRALSLWKTGQRQAAVTVAAQAQASDEEFIRSGATLLLAAAALAEQRRSQAVAQLDMLAGHDRRFAAGVVQFEQAIGHRGDARTASQQLTGVLANEDRAQPVVSQTLLEILSATDSPCAAQTAEQRSRSADRL